MAESDADRRAAGSMTEEEADRLSERFRPSWEEDVPTVPRDQAPPTPRGAEPVSSPVSSGAVPTTRVVSVTAAPVVPVTGAQSAAAAAPAATPSSTQTPLAVPKPRRPTLVGTPPAAGPPHTTATDTHAGELDWDATNPLPVAAAPAAAPSSPATAPSASPAPLPAPIAAAATPAATATPGGDGEIEIEVSVSSDAEDAAPDSKPSGVGQKYKPKDEGAPAVVLGAEVQAVESGARAKLEAEHRARRAPTLLRMQAFDLPATGAKPAALPEPEFVLPRKSRFGVVAGVGVLLLAGVAAIAIAVTRGSSRNAPEPAVSATAAATVAPDTAAPSPPPLPEAAPQTAATHGTEASPVAAPTAAPTASTPAADDSTAEHAKLAATNKPLLPAAKPVTTRPAATTKAKAPAPKPGPAAPRSGGGKSTIVRENPF